VKKVGKRERRRFFFLIALLVIVGGFWIWAFLLTPAFQARLEGGWRTLLRESRKVLGLKKKNEIPPEERKIREEVILKKMEEAAIKQDWKSLAMEYPKPKKNEPSTDEERIKMLKESPEFKNLDRELEGYLKKKEDQFLPEPPVPSLKDALDIPRAKDKGAEKIIERLLASKEKALPEKPLEENLQLGIKGPLVTRKILEKPQPPQVKVRVEAEIELTFWVLPNGMVERVLPSIKGDADLERIATQYLKQWRFTPLPKDQPQVEQWGTIPIKFKLQ